MASYVCITFYVCTHVFCYSLPTSLAEPHLHDPGVCRQAAENAIPKYRLEDVTPVRPHSTIRCAGFGL